MSMFRKDMRHMQNIFAFEWLVWTGRTRADYSNLSAGMQAMISAPLPEPKIPVSKLYTD